MLLYYREFSNKKNRNLGLIGPTKVNVFIFILIQIKENLLIRSSSVKASQIVPATQTSTHPFNIIQKYVFSIFKNQNVFFT